MTGRTSRLLVLGLAAGVLGAGLTFSQTATVPVGPNERHVKPEVNVQDGNAARNSKLWVLDFKFKSPRLIKVNIPGLGERVVWYLWYQVYNNTGQQVTFIPDFELVTHDNKQVMKKTLEKDLMPVAISFLYGKGDLKNEFNAELDTSGKYGTKADVVVKLTPKQPSAQYKALYLVASSKDFHVSQSIIIDSSNNVNHFRFFEPDFKTSIDPKKTFEFDENAVKKKNYRIIDADQQTEKAPSP